MGSYCLVEAFVVRVVGVASLSVGESILANVDDNTAVIVGRDDAGLFARSAICTHACCVVSLCTDETCTDLFPTPDACGTSGPAGTHALCTCHGSRFQLSDGAVLNGPATRPLPAYALTLDGDDALVDTGTLADPSTRA
jgi:Rieske Fe-S protein